MLKSEQKAGEYRARAAQAQAVADETVLENVRHLQQGSADRWSDMAELEEARTVRERAAVAAAAAKRAS